MDTECKPAKQLGGDLRLDEQSFISPTSIKLENVITDFNFPLFGSHSIKIPIADFSEFIEMTVKIIAIKPHKSNQVNWNVFNVSP